MKSCADDPEYHDGDIFDKREWEETVRGPFQDCPRYLRCNVNSCPLDPGFPVYNKNLPDERSCNLPKEIRTRIGAKHKDQLKYAGLTPKEWVGKQQWEALPEDEKERIRESARQRLSNIRPNLTNFSDLPALHRAKV